MLVGKAASVCLVMVALQQLPGSAQLGLHPDPDTLSTVCCGSGLQFWWDWFCMYKYECFVVSREINVLGVGNNCIVNCEQTSPTKRGQYKEKNCVTVQLDLPVQNKAK